MVIYIDSVFLLNALLDGLLLYFTGYLAGAERKFYRLLPTAALGGFYAAAVFFPWGVFLGWPPCKLLFGGLLVLLCYGWGECFWRLCLVFFALSCVLAGSVIACGFWMQTQYYVRGAYLLPVQFGLLFCSAALCFGALWLFSRGRLHHAVLGELTEAECEIMGTRVHLRVLRDSGNTLCDPLTGAPVLWRRGHGLLHPGRKRHAPIWRSLFGTPGGGAGSAALRGKCTEAAAAALSQRGYGLRVVAGIYGGTCPDRLLESRTCHCGALAYAGIGRAGV